MPGIKSFSRPPTCIRYDIDVKQGKRTFLVLLLLLAIILLIAWLLLPTLLRSNIANRLNEAGLTLEHFEIESTGLNETRIGKASATADDGSRYTVTNLRASYSPGMLQAGRLQRIEADNLLIEPSNQTQPLTEVLQALFGLMQRDWRGELPIEQLRLENFRFRIDTERHLDGSLELQKFAGTLTATLKLLTPDEPRLTFTQQESGRWLLEASNRDEDAFAGARFDASKEQPLIFNVESDLARLRQWATLFGIPFPAHNADTNATLTLKPDFDNREADFTVTGSAEAIDEPQLQIARAETVITGKLRWQDDTPDIVITGDADLILKKLERVEMQAERLAFNTSGELRITRTGLSGDFLPGLRIESDNFHLGDIVTDTVLLVAQEPQSFEWIEESGQWRFGNSSFEAELGKTNYAGFILEESDYRLTHGDWRFPLEGRTTFSIDGASSKAGKDGIDARELNQRGTGTITWPGIDQPLAVELELDARAAEARLAGSTLKQPGIKGTISLTAIGNDHQLTLGGNTRLVAGELVLDSRKLEAAQLVIAEPLALAMNAGGLEPVPDADRPIQLSLTADRIVNDSMSGKRLQMWLHGRLVQIDADAWRLEAQSNIGLSEITEGNKRLARFASDGNLELTVTPGSARLKLLPAYRLQLEALELGELQLASADIRSREGQQIQIHVNEKPATLGSGNYDIAHTGVTHPDFQLEAGSLEVIIEESSRFDAINGSLSLPEMQLSAVDQRWNTTGVKATYNLDADTLLLDGSLRLVNTGSDISYKLRQDIQNDKGELTFNSRVQGVRTLSRSLRRVGVTIPRELQLLSGTARLNGKAIWGDALDSINTNIRVFRAGGRFGEAYFSGLNSSFDLSLYPEIKGRSKSFSIPVVDLGIPVSNLKSSVSVTKAANRQPVITLRKLRASMFGGTVSGNRVKLDLNRRSNSFTLGFRNVSLAEMVRLQQFEDIDAVGNLSGTLPMTVNSSGVSISKGKVSADKSGGYIRYRPKDSGAALKSSAETEMLLKALDDYQYNALDADAAFNPNGQLTLQLRMKGKSPGLHKTRPLHLNLNLDQNILSLIKSLRAANGLNDKIDRAVKKHFKARNR